MSSNFWLIEPSARRDDSWWQGRQIWQLLVAAPSAAFARLAAERWALEDKGVGRVGNESTSANAGFKDEKLYHVRAFPEASSIETDAGNQGAVTVLAGPIDPLH